MKARKRQDANVQNDLKIDSWSRKNSGKQTIPYYLSHTRIKYVAVKFDVAVISVSTPTENTAASRVHLTKLSEHILSVFPCLSKLLQACIKLQSISMVVVHMHQENIIWPLL